MKNIKLFIGIAIAIGMGIGIVLMLVGGMIFSEEPRGSKVDNTYSMREDIESKKKLEDSQFTDSEKESKDEEDATRKNNEEDVNEEVDITEEFIFFDSDIRELEIHELVGLDNESLAYARNEIFARKGYIFKQEKFKKYFEGKSWFVPNKNLSGDLSELNHVENANIQLIMKVEKENNWDKDGKNQQVYIRGEYEENGERYVDVDFVEFLIGYDAMKAAEEDGEMEPLEYYIRNTVPKIFKVKLANDAVIRKIGMSGDNVDAEFGDFHARIYGIDFEDGIIVSIVELYTP